MITPKAIQQQASRAQVRDTQIEKDYVLSWVLYAISQQPILSQALAFKGGTVLKKAYFEDYRYSEDLDFTLLDDELKNQAIFRAFNEAFAWVLAQARIPLAMRQQDVHASGSIHFYIAYQGPLGGMSRNKRLKVDITRKEYLAFAPIEKRILTPYADLADCSLLCYRLEEVVIEKMCALLARTQARDLYDLWYLVEEAEVDLSYCWPEFERKAKYKGHNALEFTSRLRAKMGGYQRRWEGSLSGQIHPLPPFEQVTRSLGKHLRKLSIALQ